MTRPPSYVNADRRDAPEPLPLFDSRLGVHRDPSKTEARFRRFHARNPHVLAEIIRYALELRAGGLTEGAIDLVTEHLRRIEPVETTGDDWRICNDYRPFYARLAMYREPRLEGFFIVKRMRYPFDPKSVE